MNKKQLIVMWVGIIAIVLMGIYPPWMILFKPSAGSTVIYHSILDTSGIFREFVNLDKSYIATMNNFSFRVDFTRLVVQWIIVSVLTGGLIVTFKGEKAKDKQNLQVKALDWIKGLKRITLIVSIIVGLAMALWCFVRNLYIDLFYSIGFALLVGVIGFSLVWFLFFFLRWIINGFLNDASPSSKNINSE